MAKTRKRTFQNGYELALSIIEDLLEEAEERLVLDPDSAEARESVAEYQRWMANILREFPELQAPHPDLCWKYLKPPRSAMH